MAVDLEHEEIVAYASESTRGLFPGWDIVSRATLLRWRKVGVRGVKIETDMVGSKRVTSKEAISRFLQAQRENQEAIIERPIHDTDRLRRKAAVDFELAKLGVK